MSLFRRSQAGNTEVENQVSILVLMDVPLQASTGTSLTFGLLSFNPCFNGCPSSGVSVAPDKPGGVSFNPCFNGCPSSGWTGAYNGAIGEGFNPCFNGCPSSGAEPSCVWPLHHTVSILVLMDVPLQVDKIPPAERKGKSFNPCFNGCPSSGTFLLAAARRGGGFNPCFNGCPSSGFVDDFEETLQLGFNPCFNGCPSSGNRQHYGDRPPVLFQSLF